MADVASDSVTLPISEFVDTLLSLALGVDTATADGRRVAGDSLVLKTTTSRVLELTATLSREASLALFLAIFLLELLPEATVESDDKSSESRSFVLFFFFSFLCSISFLVPRVLEISLSGDPYLRGGR